MGSGLGCPCFPRMGWKVWDNIYEHIAAVSQRGYPLMVYLIFDHVTVLANRIFKKTHLLTFDSMQ
jgi:hypothetical protein